MTLGGQKQTNGAQTTPGLNIFLSCNVHRDLFWYAESALKSYCAEITRRTGADSDFRSSFKRLFDENGTSWSAHKENALKPLYLGSGSLRPYNQLTYCVLLRPFHAEMVKRNIHLLLGSFFLAINTHMGVYSCHSRVDEFSSAWNFWQFEWNS